MKVSYVANADMAALLDPGARAWRAVGSESVALIGTPAGLQPTAAIRVAWTNRSIGAVGRVEVSAVHDGADIAFRLEWADPSEDAGLPDNTSFPDAAAVALPAHPDAPLVLMGAPGAPVNAWYWRADEPEVARQVAAEGLGTSRPLDPQSVRARGGWKEGRWSVVLTRALQASSGEGAAQLVPGSESRFGVAVWEGGHQERGGIKAFSGDWLPLVLDPVPGERK